MNEFKDAFISYSRRNRSFALRLNERLGRLGLNPWLDQNEIPLAANFQEYIADSIELAHNFVLIISRDMLQSRYCRREFEWALEHGKRIVPLLLEKPSDTELDEALPPEIRNLNWIDFTASENQAAFDSAMGALTRTLHSGTDFVHRHTELLGRAVEWRDNQRRGEFLLQEQERREAEAWLRAAAGDVLKPCEPAALQCEFICESIKGKLKAADAFISFTRGDNSAHERVSESLMRHCITTWRHRKDKMTGRKFEEVVREGIEKADNFLFFITADSITEPFCLQELEYAASLNKRVITLLVDDLNPAELPEEIRAWQYLDFRSAGTGKGGSERFHSAMNELLHELSRDRSYMREHKKLLLDTLRWRRNDRSASLLMRGPALRRLESWLKAGRERVANRPLEMQIEFIEESQAREGSLQPQVFINFAPADADFAGELELALRLREKVTWSSEEFAAEGRERELQAAVTSSENFLFVISLSSIKDSNCLACMEQAHAANKRIIAVSRDDIAQGESPLPSDTPRVSLHALGGELESVHGELVRLLDRDREYVQFHTRVLRQALEWNERRKDPDLLLRGGRLGETVAWLESAIGSGKSPSPGPMVREFIQAASEAEEARREIENRRQQRVAELEKERSNLRESLAQMGARDPAAAGREAGVSMPERLRIRDRIYGNREQWRSMVRAYRRVRKGGSEILLISGEAGSGKSVFIDKFLKSLQRRNRSVAVRGVFEQGRRKTPYSALLQAFQEWVDVMLTSNMEDLDVLKTEILEATGVNARILLELLPSLEFILGDLPPVPSLPPAESLRRFQDVMLKFTGAITASGKPLTFFLDDLQWADPASLALLKLLAGSSDSSRVLLICACEVESEGMSRLLTDEEHATARLNTIVLENLNEDDITSMLMDAMEAADFTVRPLARVVLEKTHGNPSLTRNYLSTLQEHGILIYDGEARAWSWDAERINEISIQENLQEFTAERLQALPPESRDALGVAACVGARFDMLLLEDAYSALMGHSRFDVQLLVREALLLPSIETFEQSSGPGGSREVYKFAHARVRSMAYALLSEEQRTRAHLAIGRLLIARDSEHERETGDGNSRRLFDIVYQMNRGASLLTEPEDIVRLAEFNEKAGAAAKKAMAQEAALAHYESGISLLEQLTDVRRIHYDLWYRMSLAYAEALAISGDFHGAARFFDEIIEHASSIHEKAGARIVRSAVLQSSGKSAEALEAARAGLELFGVEFPRDSEDAAARQGELFELLTSPDVIEKFRELPVASDEDLLVGKLFNECIIAVYFAEPRNLAWICACNLEHVLASGITPESSVAMAWFSMALFMNGHHRHSFAYAKLSLDQTERFPDAGGFKGKTLMIACAMSLSWNYSFEKIQELLGPAFDLCHENGDMQFASYVLLCRYITSLARGDEHHLILRNCGLWRDYCRRYVPLELGQAEIRLAATRRLMGLEAEPVNAENIIAAYEAEKNATDAGESLMELARMALLFGEYRDAYLYSERALPYVEAGAAGSLVLNLLYYHVFAICCARMYRVEFEADAPGAGRYLARLDEYLEKVVHLGHSSSENFDSYRTLVEAEKFRAMGDFANAVTLYLQTIEHAGKHGYTLLQGLANEYLGELYAGRGHRFARGHFDEAAYLYLKCGARGKSEFLRRKLRGFSVSRPVLISSELSQVGARTLIQASQEIAEQFKLPGLLKKAMSLVMRHTGAERGAMLLPREGEWDLRASFDINDADVSLWEPTAMPLRDMHGGNARVCRELVEEGIRDGETKLIPAVAEHESYRLDEYVVSRDLGSMLLGLVYRGSRPAALFYLEKTRVSVAFSPREQSVLELLIPQVAVSLEIVEMMEYSSAPAG